MSINSNIYALRTKFGYTQDDIANKLGISRQTYIKFEKADSDLDTSQIQQLADFFGVSTDYLLGKTNQRNIPKQDKKLIAFYNGYKDMDSADKKMLDDIFNSIVERNKNKKKGD